MCVINGVVWTYRVIQRARRRVRAGIPYSRNSDLTSEDSAGRDDEDIVSRLPQLFYPPASNGLLSRMPDSSL